MVAGIIFNLWGFVICFGIGIGSMGLGTAEFLQE